ncbi:hypothetical protein HTV80_24080 [Streptomyces sp. Vc74B-19]|uniref:hypothetical protein n=1 Tax=unclassified Streptomyces TaxID=2593676 RepID=UPI001BFC8D50|nr:MULTISPECIES: hypothetical protein [unclassified Streptomyces]MBT3166163.1 hypothetical protein [Streptomyces sp. Vc74B-19]
MLLVLGGCSGDDSSTDEGDHDVAACRELLGAAGVDWVKDNTASETGIAPGSDDLKSAKSLFEAHAKSWDPSSEGIPVFNNSELCRVVKQPNSTGNSLSIRYGASVTAFDHPFGGDQIVTPVNTDVKLVYGKKSPGELGYFVYIRCQVKGAPAGQMNEVPLEGVMTDTLTNADGADEHLTYLLHSAQKVIAEFQCENNPQVPAEVPAGTE